MEVLQKMLDFVMTGLLMQIKSDKDLELRKLHIWDELEADNDETDEAEDEKS